MTILGFLLGSEPLAQAWRDVGGNPVAKRFSFARLPGWKRILVASVVAATWLMAALAVADLMIVWREGTASGLFPDVVHYPLHLAILLSLLFLSPTCFLLLRGNLSERAQLEEISLTRLTPEDVLVGVQATPLRAALGANAPLALLASAFQTAALARVSLLGNGSPVSAAILAEAFFSAITSAGWFCITGVVLAAGVSPGFIKAPIRGPIAWILAMTLASVTSEFAAGVSAETAAVFFPRTMTDPNVPFSQTGIAGACLGQVAYVALILPFTVLVAHSLLYGATRRFWQPMLERTPGDGHRVPPEGTVGAEPRPLVIDPTRRHAWIGWVVCLAWGLSLSVVLVLLELVFGMPNRYIPIGASARLVNGAQKILVGIPFIALVVPISVIWWQAREELPEYAPAGRVSGPASALKWAIHQILPIAPSVAFGAIAASVSSIFEWAHGRSSPVDVLVVRALTLAGGILLAVVALAHMRCSARPRRARLAWLSVASGAILFEALLWGGRNRDGVLSHVGFQLLMLLGAYSLAAVVRLVAVTIPRDSRTRRENPSMVAHDTA